MRLFTDTKHCLAVVCALSILVVLTACSSSNHAGAVESTSSTGVSDESKFCGGVRAIAKSASDHDFSSALSTLSSASVGELHQNIVTLQAAKAATDTTGDVEPAVQRLVAVARSLCGVEINTARPEWRITKQLSHTAVEQYIETSSSFGHPTNVICNGGRDVKVAKGVTFTCVAADASTFHVEITNPNEVDYLVTLELTRSLGSPESVWPSTIGVIQSDPDVTSRGTSDMSCTWTSPMLT